MKAEEYKIYVEVLEKKLKELNTDKKELIGMLNSINTIMWESGMIKGKEVDKISVMEVLEKFSSKY